MKNLNKPLKIILLAALLCLCLCLGAFAAEAEPAEAEPAEADAVTEATVEESASAFLLDLEDAENPEELAAMIDKGYIVGYSDGSFRPGRTYTRVELAQFVTALCDLETDAAALPDFYDTDIYAKDAIDAAVSNGLMTGRNDTSFAPYGEVLKAELVGTLDKAASLLGIDNFYELLGNKIGWASDYTVCTAAEAMHAAYALDTAVNEARDAALKDAAALLAAMASEEPELELVFEPAEDAAEEVAEAEDAAEPEEAPAEDMEEVPADDSEAAEEAAEMNGSNEPSGEASSEASGEASAEPKTDETAEQSAPPAGVTTPAGSQPAQQSTPVAPAAPAQTEADEVLEGEDIIIQKVVDIYNTVRSNIVDLLSGLFA